MIKCVSLKIYWQQENTSSNPPEYNQWLDKIESQNLGPFSQKQIRHNIAYGDYLFVCVESNMLKGYAICSDYPPPISVWDQSDKKLGHLTINLLRSYEKGYGKILLNEVENFASSILVRKEIQLTSLTASKLIQYYKSHGYVQKSSSKEGILFIKSF